MNQFIEEIYEQPNAIKKTLEYYVDQNQGGKLLQLAQEIIRKKKIDHIIYTGMGSSFFNSQIPFYYLNAHGVSCEVRESGEFAHYLSSDSVKGIIIAVSQSGESGEVIELVKKISKSQPNSEWLWAITNNEKSTLGKNASLVFPTLAGKETSVTSKTYTTGLLLHYLIARAIIGKDVNSKKFIASIIDLTMKIGKNLLSSKQLFYEIAKEIDDFFGDITFLNFIGQGTAMSTVMQATLNIKEIAKIAAEGLTIGMFRHGPIELIDASFRCVLIINDSKGAEIGLILIKNMINKWGGGKILLITNQQMSITSDLDQNVKIIVNPVDNPYLAPIYEMILLQPYLCLLAEKHGFVPGEFRNTQKITK